MARIELIWDRDTGAVCDVHVRGTATPFLTDARLNGDPYDLDNEAAALYGFLERLGNVTGSSHAFAVSKLNSPSGAISGTIPYTGIGWTGPSLLHIFATGSPRRFYGDARLIDVRGASSDLVP